MHRPSRVLIVDFCDRENAQMGNLLREGFGVDGEFAWTNAGEDALIDLAIHDYDFAIFLDLGTGENGLNTIREALTVNARVPFILVTSATSHAIEADIIVDGMADCIALDELTPALMRRMVRYSQTRKRTEGTLRESNDELIRGILQQREAKEQAQAQSQANKRIADELAQAKQQLEVALQSAQDSEVRFRRLSEHSPIGIWHLGPDGRTIYLNSTATDILEVDEQADTTNINLEDLVVPAELSRLEAPQQAWRRGAPREVECRIIGPVSGIEKHLFIAGSPFSPHDKQDGSVLLSLMDISERKKSDAIIQHLAHHDSLTGLPNRSLFQDRLDQASAMTLRTKKQTALLFLDLDNFKDVNDTLGHPIGDQLLRQVAARLQTCVRQSDTVARLGGDEFAIVYSNLEDSGLVQPMAQRIINLISEPFLIDGERIRTSASIGVALVPDDTDRTDRLIKFADMALYHAKSMGRNCFQYFNAGMDEEMRRRKAMEEDLRQAIDQNAFSLAYQPQLHLEDGAVFGAEALLRWQHPTRGNIPPFEFIPLAESNGMIREIGHWVLRTACAQARSWMDAGHPAIQVSVNLSAVEFMSDDLLEKVKAVLLETRLPPQHLELEITESAVMTDMDKAIKTMAAIRQIGVSLAIDDFGTGFSSLSYLKKFPVQVLKIDRSFVQDILTNPEDAAIASAIVNLGQSLGLNVVAEGVEEAEQADCLRNMGCRSAQGYYFGRPVPAVEFYAMNAAG